MDLMVYFLFPPIPAYSRVFIVPSLGIFAGFYRCYVLYVLIRAF